ncbi:hypothetical protein Btru_040613 [Bulinus truncatus]|nr:hypothetical protein Btru_040613 [Bulinus truncatus]
MLKGLRINYSLAKLDDFETRLLEEKISSVENIPYADYSVKSSKDIHQFQVEYANFKTVLDEAHAGNGFDPAFVDAHGFHLIHIAVLKNETKIVKSILDSEIGPLELNAMDRQKRTALYYAVAKQNLEIVDLLLRTEAKTNIPDSTEKMPIHIAASLKDTHVLELLLKYHVNPNSKGEAGYTPLHFAAFMDNGIAVTLLLQHGADLNRRCFNGAYPVHIAARCGCLEALTAMFEYVKKCGLDTTSLLQMKDNDDHNTLSTAVCGGFEEVVQFLLNCGASLISGKEDGVTPMHYAAAQNEREVLRIMNEKNPDEMLIGLYMCDSKRRTPLHMAACFNQCAALTYLLDLYDRIDVTDHTHKTPLLLAAACGAFEAVDILITKGARLKVKDIHDRNLIHYLVLNKMDMRKICNTLKSNLNIIKLVNDKDLFGSTPIHYAANRGYLGAIYGLLKLGADASVKDSHKQTAFHLAVISGKYKTFLALLSSPKGKMLAESRDDQGVNLIHLAAQYGHVKILTVLIQTGVRVRRDITLNTPLHLASAKGKLDCVHYLLNVRKDLIDCRNTFGDTSLHLAARYGHAEVVSLLLSAGAKLTYNTGKKCFYDDVLINDHFGVAEAIADHVRWQECLQLRSHVHGLLSLGLISHFPFVFKNVLDKCVARCNLNQKSLNYFVTYNFRYLGLGQDYKKFKYGFIIVAFNLALYCLFLSSITTFVTNHWGKNHYHSTVQGKMPLNSESHMRKVYLGELPSYGREINKTQLVDGNGVFHWDQNWFPPEAHTVKTNEEEKFHLLTIVLFSVFHLLVNIVQIILHIKKSFTVKIFNTVIEVVLYICSVFFSLTYFFGYSIHPQWPAAAIAVFLAWFYALVNLQSVDYFGIYILMFIVVMKTLVKVLLIFFMLLTAFGLSFYVMLNNEPLQSHLYPLQAIYRTFIQIFELSYLLFVNEGFQDNSPETAHFGIGTYILLAFFLFFLPVMLVNLMIGLAVGDIAAVRQDAQERKIALQVKFHVRLEFILPLLSKSVSEKIILYPNRFSILEKFIGKFRKIPITQNVDVLARDELQNIENSIKGIQTICNKVQDILVSMRLKLGLSDDDENDDDDESEVHHVLSDPYS